MYSLYFDGCSKGNPGIAGAGAVLYDENKKELWTISHKIIEKQTNNFAEYTGLILGLKKCIEYGVKDLEIYGDSQLVIRQIQGTYKVKSSNLVLLYKMTIDLLSTFNNVTINHVYRNNNYRADELANIAIL